MWPIRILINWASTAWRSSSPCRMEQLMRTVSVSRMSRLLKRLWHQEMFASWRMLWAAHQSSTGCRSWCTDEEQNRIDHSNHLNMSVQTSLNIISSTIKSQKQFNHYFGLFTSLYSYDVKEKQNKCLLLIALRMVHNSRQQTYNT